MITHSQPSIFWRTVGIGLSLILAAPPARQAAAQDVEIWEYSPYKICIWLSLDVSIDKSQVARLELIEQLEQQLARTFAAAWKSEIASVPEHMQFMVQRHLDELNADDFSDTDLCMVLDKSNDALKTLRVFETAVDQLDVIGILDTDRQQLSIDAQSTTGDGELAQKLLDKTSQIFASYAELVSAIKEKRIAAAMIPRMHLPLLTEVARPLATTLPWHTERFLREYEKLLIIHCEQDGEEYRVAVREIDCPMRLFGPEVTGSTANWQNLPALMCTQIVEAFAPVARIEEVNGRLVMMLNRAGGLASPGNPVLIEAGQVLQPVIRREDRRGAATLLEPIPWTYIGVTRADGIQLEGTAYSALGNILQGKQTRRAQRVALRVRPQGTRSDVKVVVRTNPSETQPGCQIYQRDLVTDDMRFIGHTDWRGIITIERSEPLGNLLPERIKIEQAEARRAAQAAADKAAMEAEAAKRSAEKSAAAAPASAAKPGDDDTRGPAAQAKSNEAQIVDGPGSTATPAVPAAVEPMQTQAVADAKLLAQSVPLTQPLVLLYVKSGDTVLARLPLVPGLNEVDIADLPSDARRLEAEAHFRGFQGEVLDLIAKRAILSSRVSLHLKDRKFKEAEELIEQARRLPDYKMMSDTLNSIQRRMLDESKEPVPPAAKTRIDRMMVNTRDMLQKYVEKDIILKLQGDVQAARNAASAEDKAAEEKAAKEKEAAEAAAKETEAARTNPSSASGT